MSSIGLLPASPIQNTQTFASTFAPREAQTYSNNKTVYDPITVPAAMQQVQPSVYNPPQQALTDRFTGDIMKENIDLHKSIDKLKFKTSLFMLATGLVGAIGILFLHKNSSSEAAKAGFFKKIGSNLKTMSKGAVGLVGFVTLVGSVINIARKAMERYSKNKESV